MLPGGQMSKRPLHFIWICDCSGSMSVNGKIETLNNAIRQSIPLMREAAADNPHVEVLVRVITFSDGAQWQIAQAVPVENFEWNDLVADGVTDLGKALSMVAEQLKVPPMTNRALPPVLVLITDGQPTDDFGGGLKTLLEQPWGKKAVKIAIAVGQDADRDVLQRFIAHPELKPLDANNPDALVARIKWVSSGLLSQVSQPLNNQTEGRNGDDPWVTPPTITDPDSGLDQTLIF
jgi:uncharacterized protein YegL